MSHQRPPSLCTGIIQGKIPTSNLNLTETGHIIYHELEPVSLLVCIANKAKRYKACFRLFWANFSQT